MSTDIVLLMPLFNDWESAAVLLAEWERSGENHVVFAERSKRLENLTFRSLYHLYRWLHLTQLAVMPELRNRYAAAIIRPRAYRADPSRGKAAR